MKILIFGSSSKTAYSLFKECTEDKYNVFLWYSTKNKPEWFIGDNWFVGDYSDEDFIKNTIEMHKPDYVVNLSAITNVDVCEDDKEKTILINYLIPKLLAELSSEYGYNLIHISTDYVFDGISGPYEIDEKTSETGIGIYAMTKRDSEKHTLEHNGCVIRTNLLYGSNLPTNDFFEWLKNELKNNKIPIITCEQFSNPTLINDLAKVILMAIQKNLKGILHTGGKDWGSRWEFAQVLAISLNLNDDLDNLVMTNNYGLNQKAIRPKFAGLIIDRSESIIDYTFSGFYDYVLENTNIPKFIDEKENPHWLIFEKLISVLRLLPIGLKKNSIIDLKKNDHGTLSLYISTEKLWTEIEIGKTTLSGVLYALNGDSGFDLINGDVFEINEISSFISQVNDLVCPVEKIIG